MAYIGSDTRFRVQGSGSNIGPKGPCTQIVYTLTPKYLYRHYFEAKVYMDP